MPFDINMLLSESVRARDRVRGRLPARKEGMYNRKEERGSASMPGWGNRGGQIRGQRRNAKQIGMVEQRVGRARRACVSACG